MLYHVVHAMHRCLRALTLHRCLVWYSLLFLHLSWYLVLFILQLKEGDYVDVVMSADSGAMKVKRVRILKISDGRTNGDKLKIFLRAWRSANTLVEWTYELLLNECKEQTRAWSRLICSWNVDYYKRKADRQALEYKLLVGYYNNTYI